MKIHFVIPGDINLPTGGYRYDRVMIEHWEKAGCEVKITSLSGNYPFPGKDDLNRAKDMLESFPEADMAIVDGLAGGGAPEIAEHLCSRCPVVSLVHHPLCLEDGLSEAEASQLKSSEATGLARAAMVVTTSETTARTVNTLFNYPASRIFPVVPGVVRAEPATGSGSSVVNLLCVASLVKRKNHETLFRCLSGLRNLEWKLDCAGMTGLDKELFERLGGFVKKTNMRDRITFHGAVDETQLHKLYQKTDIFVLPSKYEGYGMAYVEAIIRGIPVIGTTMGAAPETVPRSCGILVDPEDENALSDALETLITDGEKRAACRQAALRAADQFPTWQKQANKFLNLLQDAS